MAERAIRPPSAARPPGPGARLVVATTNQGKLAELTRILAAARVAVELVSLSGLAGLAGEDVPVVRETGATFAANALAKARAIVAWGGLPAVADDSGLCVDALNGMPGVLSARWSGRGATAQRNIALLLDQLADVPDERLGAHFACAAALVLPAVPGRGPGAGRGQAREHVREAMAAGRLIREPRGDGGFGYDPIFVPGPAELTMAQLSPAAKDAISHRGRALRALAPVIAAELGQPGQPGRRG